MAHLGIDPKIMKIYVHVKNLYLNVYSSFICNSQNWTQPKCPSTGEWLNKGGPFQPGIPASHGKEGAIDPSNNLEGPKHRAEHKKGQVQRVTHCVIPFIQHSQVTVIGMENRLVGSRVKDGCEEGEGVTTSGARPWW